jgi:hypothetical protein
MVRSEEREGAAWKNPAAKWDAWNIPITIKPQGRLFRSKWLVSSRKCFVIRSLGGLGCLEKTVWRRFVPAVTRAADGVKQSHSGGCLPGKSSLGDSRYPESVQVSEPSFLNACFERDRGGRPEGDEITRRLGTT